MIYVTGDIHGDPRRFSADDFPAGRELTKEDYVIICGDFGLVWFFDGESKNEKYWLDWLESRPWTTLFVDGNHENFWRIDEYPEIDWHGGKVHMIRPSVLHLKRGEIFEICNKKIFTFGGARSHDISDGILDPVMDSDLIREWERDYNKLFRILGRSWWPQEMPVEEEMQYGCENLARHDWKVDYIFSHDCAASTKALIGNGFYKSDELNKYLENIRQKCDFKIWFFGHLHEDRIINNKEMLIYERILRIC